MRTRWVMTGLSLCACAVGLGLFGYSMTQQTAIQGQMNQTMVQLNDNVKETIPLVQATSTALVPLTSTTTALSQIELQEEQTVSDLAAMNNHLRTIGVTEGQVLSGMNALFSTTSNVDGALGAVQGTGAQVLGTSQSAAGSASSEASDLGTLNSRTGEVISELHQLNTKLAALKLLP